VDLLVQSWLDDGLHPMTQVGLPVQSLLEGLHLRTQVDLPVQNFLQDERQLVQRKLVGPLVQS
jgi:hypothetical protein